MAPSDTFAIKSNVWLRKYWLVALALFGVKLHNGNQDIRHAECKFNGEKKQQIPTDNLLIFWSNSLGNCGLAA